MCKGVGLVVGRGGLFDEIDQERERESSDISVYTLQSTSHTFFACLCCDNVSRALCSM